MTKSRKVQKNYFKHRLACAAGSISFGTISHDETTTYGPMLSTPKGDHCFIMEAVGVREGNTSSYQYGRFQVECGSSFERKQEAMMLNAKNGNINIIASDGDIRIQGRSVEIIALGENSSDGNILINASTKLFLEGKEVVLKAIDHYRIASEGTSTITALGVMTLYAGVLTGVSSACGIIDDKYGHQRIVNKEKGIS